MLHSCFSRTWILTLNYGYCFGVELTVNNIIVAYLFDQFGLSFEIAGIVGAVFGLMNIGSRSLGERRWTHMCVCACVCVSVRVFMCACAAS